MKQYKFKFLYVRSRAPIRELLLRSYKEKYKEADFLVFNQVSYSVIAH